MPSTVKNVTTCGARAAAGYCPYLQGLVTDALTGTHPARVPGQQMSRHPRKETHWSCSTAPPAILQAVRARHQSCLCHTQTHPTVSAQSTQMIKASSTL